MRQIQILFLIYFFFLTPSLADEIKPAFLQIKALNDNVYDVVWRIPVKKNKKPLAISIEFDSSVKNIQQPVGTYVAKSYIQNWRIYKEGTLAGSTIKINGLSSTNIEVLLRIIDNNGIKTLIRISPRKPVYTFAKEPSKFNTINTYTVLGFEHILEGTDHLLFVACLVMIASTFSKLIWTITGFTLAHSVTLFLSAMGLVSIPIAPIEAVIALSIVFLALEIAKANKSSLTYRYPVVVSSSFGLLHGFGFASALMEIGLPQNERVIALLFFNVGVELGQLVFVAFLLISASIIHMILKNSTIILWSKPASYVIGSIATMWLFERVLAF